MLTDLTPDLLFSLFILMLPDRNIMRDTNIFLNILVKGGCFLVIGIQTWYNPLFF